jgi:hypothetical protein
MLTADIEYDVVYLYLCKNEDTTIIRVNDSFKKLEAIFIEQGIECRYVAIVIINLIYYLQNINIKMN